jgi:NAD(P)-dependent dehydrogenase (short-subunit alcohol dehydrogenase family)
VLVILQVIISIRTRRAPDIGAGSCGQSCAGYLMPSIIIALSSRILCYLNYLNLNIINMSNRLKGKVAIVTGGASGFGRGIAAKFVEEGAKVVIADLSNENSKKVARELGCEYIVTDVTKREAWQALLQKTIDAYGGLDIVINNAGATYSNKATTQVTDEDFDLCMNVNVRSVYLSSNIIVPYFLDRKKPGCFIQISSTAAIRPRPNLTWYNASKSAVSIATKTLAVEYGPHKIRFNAVCPVVGITGM